MTSILIVEDDSGLSRLYGKYLKWAGFEPIYAADCESARLILGLFTPRMVLLDMNLPDGNGLSLIRYCKGDQRLAGVEIVVVSANDQFRPYVEQQGVDYFLCKPVAMPMLLELIRRLTGSIQVPDMAEWQSGSPL